MYRNSNFFYDHFCTWQKEGYCEPCELTPLKKTEYFAR